MSAGGCRSCVASGVANSGRRGRGVRALLGNRAALTWQRADLSVTVAFHSFGVGLLFVTFFKSPAKLAARFGVRPCSRHFAVTCPICIASYFD